MLILFDIDGTLLLTRNAGRDAMIAAGRELVGERFSLDNVEIAGRLDPLIFADALAACGIDAETTCHETFRTMYAEKLRARLEANPTAELLPGVEALVNALASEAGVTLGLLTGNWPETGRLKVAAAGLDPEVFEVHAWGCDGAARRDLPAVALQRYAALRGSAIEAARTVIIGDTPHDVDCAAAHGCRCLAVATGRYDVEMLAACRPDRVVESLAATDDLLRWIMKREMAPMD